MEIKYICTFWGQEQTPADEFVARAMDAGYDGIELNIPFNRQFTGSLERAVSQQGAVLIAQQWLPPAHESVDQWEINVQMKRYLRENLS